MPRGLYGAVKIGNIQHYRTLPEEREEESSSVGEEGRRELEVVGERQGVGVGRESLSFSG